ncbi:Transcription initiation protein spt3 [Coemansia sp. RSA 989]|nr:transcription initiation factor IID, 18kD subunit-domain-containing protein [Coemansia mojavensis]KAJ1740131.1 Transcription initiation protein spt3 [Coemansia sp. RSA 1086]KAJ1750840.1 Transcription initiation protein spt3 [Coemansia sp. RSA 1821]KAJ1862770.1 Transcription initiation protein spt3 [Coemansia sp. RSA 989]KAJ1872743.1 Transcription initiation protein spt3 [Coemansia sp. RSA 990]KAJ2453190.1 Transcription initiation protein spt3 [Coemansia sp. RSA 2336]KAJ2632089.1 Transcript
MEKGKDRDRQSKYRYLTEIQQMMFVFGEIQDPLTETTMLIEDIVRSQVIEIIVLAAAQAQRRGSRFLAAEDFIFLIRHDRTKVLRLREYLSWKDVRKKVKEREDAGDDIIDDATADKPDRVAKVKIKLSWELASAFSENLVDDDDEDDDEMLDAQSDSLKRLRDADEVTKQMTRDEYVHYSECRQASFTFRKNKRFRDWANMSSYLDTKLNDEIIDILGFLTFEMVSTITETALRIKRGLDKAADAAPADQPKRPRGDDASAAAISLFSGPPTARTPLEVQHVQEAFRRLQRAPQPIRNFKGGLTRTRVSLI